MIFKQRATFDEMENRRPKYINEDVIAAYTPLSLAIPTINFFECAMYSHFNFNEKSYKIFKILKDYGVNFLTCGTSGGAYHNYYRTFQIEYKKITKFVSLSTNAYSDDNTIICVAIALEDNRRAHHSLQLSVRNLEIDDNKVKFYHNGRISIGNLGSGKKSELIKFVKEEYPQIIDSDRFYLGTLTHDRLWNLDDPEVMNLVENLISYALIRDEYREYIKNHRK